MDTLGRARTTFEQREWADSYRLFAAAECDRPLDAENLERYAIAAYLTGRDDESEALWARAHQAFLDRGAAEGAARAAGWLAFGSSQCTTVFRFMIEAWCGRARVSTSLACSSSTR